MAGTANSIITPQTPRSNAFAGAFTANTNLTATPTNTVKVVTAGASGARLTKLRAIPVATVTATQLQLFRSRDAGASKHACNLQATVAYSMAATTAPSAVDFGYSDENPMLLQANEELYVAAGVTGSWSFEAEWADY